jgi:poly-gamma-glutamate capsule biosynthesis protein CapA/YwtB (metallophosphatase superfamily)
LVQKDGSAAAHPSLWARLRSNRRARLALRALIVAVALAGAGSGSWIWFWTYYDPRVEVPPPAVRRFGNAVPGPSTALFLGDTASTDASLTTIRKRGHGYVFDGTRALVGGATVTVVNLEAPFTESDDPNPRRPAAFRYKIPPEAVSALREAGVDAVTLGNNHINDYGRRGIEDTVRTLDGADLLHAGAGLSEKQARRGFVLETPGGRLGVLSYLENQRHWRLRNLAFALDTPFHDWHGAARLRSSDLAEDIARLRRYADVIAVVPHFGHNYEPIIEDQVTLGETCIDLGADVVIGHHPHVAQPAGMYRGKPIFYSLGNYAFGTPAPRTQRFGMAVQLHLAAGRLAAVEVVPLLTQNRLVKFQPRIPNGRLLEEFFAEIIAPSAERGAVFERRGDRAWLEL